MDGLTDPAGIAALAAGALALIALVVLALLWRRMGALRRDQQAVLGDSERDLVRHAADIERQFAALHEWVIDVVTRVESRLDRDEERLDGTIAHRAVVRYDAYNELSGRQSTSIALLDARRSGIVLSGEAFDEVVRGGGLKPNGMPDFAELTDGELADLRQYIRSRAAAAK